MSLKAALADHISTHGPMPVADYMRRCAEHYYATRDPFGKGGDFTTSPEISQIFGELIGAWLANAWANLGSPPVTLCEMGPGRGTLMKDILRATASVPGFYNAIHILLIENSPTLCALQKQTLKNVHPRITWQNAADSFPTRPLLLVANEFFDALPIEQYIVGDKQRAVDYRDGTFVWHKDGTVIRETSPASEHITSRIAGQIHKYSGAALIIDYGYEGGTQADTLQALHHHRFVSPLENPGEADITAHVDFGALRKAAEKEGVAVFGTEEQGTFLRRLGAELRAAALCKTCSPDHRNTILSGLERLVAPHQMGALFKVMALTSSVDKPAGF